MNTDFRYVTVNYPNIPVLGTSHGNDKPCYGTFLPSPSDPLNADLEDLAGVTSIDMYLPNFSLRVLEGKFNRDAMLMNRKGEGSELLGSCLFLKGKVKSVLDGESEGIESFQRQQDFKYDPENHFRHIVPGEKPFHFMHFSYTVEFLIRILPEGERWAEELKSKIANGERVFGKRPVEINMLQERALHTIFHNPLQGKLGIMMAETAMVQIILLQLNGLFKSCEDNYHGGMQKRDVEIIHEVKDHIHKTFLEDHSLSNLALHFGVNTNKLMNTFKKMFGKSIFEYIQELRMEYAQQLLREEDLQVTQVARTIGYKNPNHFSAAFKRQFGYSPSEPR